MTTILKVFYGTTVAGRDQHARLEVDGLPTLPDDLAEFANNPHEPLLILHGADGVATALRINTHLHALQPVTFRVMP